ncbi:histone H1-like [Cheilinus undulatus]|uniref:histone H1-like n=1 Tax=Cheilinus undulatus TaxID=241271 RepID=UPI001BD54587|nr:histone H1-like [Cheilinus undulatus]
MAEEAQAKVQKKKPPRTRGTRVQLGKLVLNAVKVTSGRKGTSVVAIKKNLKSNGVDVKKCNKQINNTIIRLKNKGVLVQVKGNGASGSFKLAKAKTETKKTTTRKITKRKIIKKKKTTEKKKKTTPKKKDTKKTGVKKAAGKSPKKGAAKKNTKKAAGKKTTPRKPKPVRKTPGKRKPVGRKTTPKKGKK